MDDAALLYESFDGWRRMPDAQIDREDEIVMRLAGDLTTGSVVGGAAKLDAAGCQCDAEAIAPLVSSQPHSLSRAAVGADEARKVAGRGCDDCVPIGAQPGEREPTTDPAAYTGGECRGGSLL